MINTSNKEFEIVLNQGKELLQFYRENPCIALYDLLGVDLAPIQRLLFNDMWFKNYVIGICSRGLGKSVSCNSLAYLKDQGLIYLNEELPKVPSYLNDGEDVTIDFKKSLYTSKGFRNIKKLCLEKNIKGKKLTTTNNFIHEGSNQHPLLTIDNNGEFIYKMSEDFKVNDPICILVGQKIFTDIEIDIDDSYLMGLLLSESMAIDNLGNVSILINNDNVLNFCKIYCLNNNIHYKCYKHKKLLNTYGFIFENFNWFINKYKIQDIDELKSISKIVRTSSKISQINFLKGYFSINNIINNDHLIVCCSTSKKLLREIQIMLLNFGVITKVYKEGKDLYIIEVLSDSIKVFRKEIFGKGSNVIKKYYIDTIKSVEDWVGDCYDFMMDMEEEPNYFANGFINHNTYLLGALATLSSLLFPGHRVGLIGPSFRQCFSNEVGNLNTFWTSDGLKIGQDFFDSIECGKTKIQSLETQNVILNKWENPKRACMSIKTTRGFEISGTVDHKVLILDENLDLKFKELQDITKESNIAIKKGFNYFGNDNSLPEFNFKMNWRHSDCNIPKELTSDLSYFCGLIIGDGCVSFKKSKRLEFINKDKDLINFYIGIVEKYFNVILKIRNKDGIYRLHVTCEKLCTFLIKCGFSYTNALEKKIPTIIKQASKECFKGFLQGLYDSDGCCVISKLPHKNCVVKLSTSSLQLGKEVQAVLLNFGIMSSLLVHRKAENYKLSCGNKISKCATSYKVNITGISDLLKFRDEIGFRAKRKMNTLCSYFDLIIGKCTKSCSIPNSTNIALILAKECKFNNVSDLKTINVMIINFRQNKSISTNRLNILLEIAKKNNILTNEYYKIKKIIDLDLAFVTMKESKFFNGETVDIEVNDENCYFSNGFISHNSRMIFSEVEKIYDQSPLLREAVQKKPTRHTDSCFLKFKAIGGNSGSFIEALPLGVDGSKIRGSRFYTICIDELAQVPSKIVDLVIRPFAATTLSPMENVRQMEQQKRLIDLGIASEDDFEDKKVNKMIVMSSGFYKFNHIWKRMQDHWLMVDKEGENSRYSVWQIPYTDLPDGFLDTANIQESKRIMSIDEFRMEYEAEMISDSEGFFKASLLESCTTNSGHTVELLGKSKSSYILGVDPNQAGSAGCGIVIIKLGEVNRIVKCINLKVDTTQKITTCIQSICSQFKIERIFMDKGGGGKAVCDLLEEGYNDKEPIIDITNIDHINMKGRHILEMVVFTPSWISDANFTTKALLESNSLLFPEAPVGSTKDEAGEIFEDVDKLKSQMRSIVVTQTPSGLLHFDTPKKHQNKDLYSALILLGYGVKFLLKEQEKSLDPILHNAGGLVKGMEPGASWQQHQLGGLSKVSDMAVLNRKK